MITDTWEYPDCTVTEMENDHDLHCFVVSMERDGEVRTQTVFPRDVTDRDGIVRDLNGGISPVGTWEDGLGRPVHWDNATPEDPEGGEE